VTSRAGNAPTNRRLNKPSIITLICRFPDKSSANRSHPIKRSDFLRITTTGLASRSALGLWMVERISTEASAQGATSTLRLYLQTNLDGSVWVSY